MDWIWNHESQIYGICRETSWCFRQWTPDWVRMLSGVILLCSWAKHAVMTQTLTSPRLINGYRPANETWAGLEFNPGRGEGWQKYPYSLHAVGPEIMPRPDGALDSDTDTIPDSGRVQVHFNTRLLDNNSGSNHGSYFPPESSLPCTDVQKLTPRKSNDLSSYNRLMTSLQENTKTTAMYT